MCVVSFSYIIGELDYHFGSHGFVCVYVCVVYVYMSVHIRVVVQIYESASNSVHKNVEARGYPQISFLRNHLFLRQGLLLT